MKRTALLAALAAITSMLPGTSQANPTGCAPDAPGGEWRTYGGGYDGQRNQEAATIDADWVSSMAPKWIVPTSLASAKAGSFENTPIVVDGCVYLGSNAGVVYALNADTGALVWGNIVEGQGQSLLGGVIVGSLTVEGGVVFVGVQKPGNSYVAAFDQTTGVRLWRTIVENDQNSSLISSSPIVFDGLLYQGFAGAESGSVARGGHAILDASHDCGGDAFNELGKQVTFCDSPVPGATGGTRLYHGYTISDAEYAAGYRGASEWCSPAYDPVDRYVYSCGGNPASKRIEAPFSNALLKVDADPSRETFGEIVAAYKGDNDQYYPGMDRQPACDLLGDTLVVVWSLACLQLDLDFGASPQLWRDSIGRLMLGDLQKSGIYHAVFAGSMSRAWTQVVGTPGVAFNSSSGAYGVVGGEGRVFVTGTPGGIQWGLSADQGRYRWAHPILDGIHYQATSFANGMVFVIDNGAFVTVIDGDTGLPIAKRNVAQDTGTPAVAQSSNGIAIARNMVFVNVGSNTIAYAAP